MPSQPVLEPPDEPGTSSIHEPPPKRKKEVVKSVSDSLEELETAETRKLTTSQLQRLVLLEQLQVLRLKKEKLLRAQNEVQTNAISTDDDGRTFQML